MTNNFCCHDINEQVLFLTYNLITQLSVIIEYDKVVLSAIIVVKCLNHDNFTHTFCIKMLKFTL